MTATVRLHAPDEPIARARFWREALEQGAPLEEVVVGPGGISEWAWDRWRAIEVDGVKRGDLDAIILGSRRELWLWLVGERTWSSAIGSVLGRLSRRS